MTKYFIALIAFISPLVWWFLYHILYSLALSSNSNDGLGMACIFGGMFSYFGLLSLAITLED